VLPGNLARSAFISGEENRARKQERENQASAMEFGGRSISFDSLDCLIIPLSAPHGGVL
jgi:hypothetical protein